jgi:hypothetical protein
VVRVCGILLCLISFLSDSSWAKSRDEKLEVEMLLQTIEAGQQSEAQNPLLVYDRLDEFAPYSYRTSNRILDFVVDAIKNDKKTVNVPRLLQTFNLHPVTYPRIYRKIARLLTITSSDQLRLLIANILSRSPQTEALAYPIFYSVMLDPNQGVMTRIHLAVKLLGYAPADAEATLISFLGTRETTLFVFGFFSVQNAPQISLHLLAALQESLQWFSAVELDYMTDRLEILKKFRIPSPAKCEPKLVMPIQSSTRH